MISNLCFGFPNSKVLHALVSASKIILNHLRTKLSSNKDVQMTKKCLIPPIIWPRTIVCWQQITGEYEDHDPPLSSPPETCKQQKNLISSFAMCSCLQLNNPLVRYNTFFIVDADSKMSDCDLYFYIHSPAHCLG